MLLAHMWLLAGAIMRPALRPLSCSPAARCASPLSCATAAVEDAVDDDAPPLLRVLRAGGLDAAQAQEVYERRPPGKLPGAVRQELLLEWVQRELLCSREPARRMFGCGVREGTKADAMGDARRVPKCSDASRPRA